MYLEWSSVKNRKAVALLWALTISIKNFEVFPMKFLFRLNFNQSHTEVCGRLILGFLEQKTMKNTVFGWLLRNHIRCVRITERVAKLKENFISRLPRAEHSSHSSNPRNEFMNSKHAEAPNLIMCWNLSSSLIDIIKVEKNSSSVIKYFMTSEYFHPPSWDSSTISHLTNENRENKFVFWVFPGSEKLDDDE